MNTIIALIPALPMVSFLILVLFSGELPRKVAGWIGAGSIGIAAVLTVIVGVDFFSSLPGIKSYEVSIWQWMSVGNLSANIAFRLDSLSLVFCFVITFVGFLIHTYSIGFMDKDEGIIRFFAYMNLFVSSMLILVLADNILL